MHACILPHQPDCTTTNPQVPHAGTSNHPTPSSSSSSLPTRHAKQALHTLTHPLERMRPGVLRALLRRPPPGEASRGFIPPVPGGLPWIIRQLAHDPAEFMNLRVADHILLSEPISPAHSLEKVAKGVDIPANYPWRHLSCRDPSIRQRYPGCGSRLRSGSGARPGSVRGGR